MNANSPGVQFTLLVAFLAALNACNSSTDTAASDEGTGTVPNVPGANSGTGPSLDSTGKGPTVPVGDAGPGAADATVPVGDSGTGSDDSDAGDGGTTPPTPTQEELNQQAVEAARDALVIGFTAPEDTDVNHVSGDVVLPTSDPANDVEIAWATSNPDLVSNTGQVTRPPFDYGFTGVTLTATFTKGDITVTRDFELVVVRESAFFVRDENMYRTDGTYAGTENATYVPLAGLIPEAPKDNGPLPVLGETVFFVSRERDHATQGRIPLAGGGELYGYNFAKRSSFGAIDIGPGALSGVPDRLVWEYVGTGNDKKVRFRALDVAPGSNVNSYGLQCTDVQIWETDGVWRGIPKSLSATKISGCPELYNLSGPIIVNPLDPSAQLNLQNLVVNAVNYNDSKVIVNFNANGDKPLTSGTLALAMLDFGDYLRPHVEDRIKQLDAVIADALGKGTPDVVSEHQNVKAVLQEALDKYIGANKSDANKQEFMSRMTSSGAHAAFMGAGQDLDALALRFTAQERKDVQMRVSLTAALANALRQAVKEGKTLSVSQKNIAARTAKHINEKRDFLRKELDRMELEYVQEKARVGANNMWAFKTLPDIATAAEQNAHRRLIAAAIGVGAGAAVGTSLAIAVTAAHAAIFLPLKANALLGTAAVSTATMAAWAVPGIVATAVGVLVVGAVSVAMLIEEAENQAAFANARARATTSAQTNLSNLDLMNNSFDQADYLTGFLATFNEVP